MKIITFFLASIITTAASNEFRVIKLEKCPPFKVIKCAKGKFEMGPNRQDFENAFETKVAEVQLSPFEIAECEVTQELWEAIMEEKFGEYASKQGLLFNENDLGSGLPAFGINYYDSLYLCEMMTKKARKINLIEEGMEFRIPTEAEWEYACRSASETLYSFGDEIGGAPANINYKRNEGSGLIPVELGHSNQWGIKNMHGNVAEWVLDALGPLRSGAVDPVLLKYEDIRRPFHIARGGAYYCIDGAGESRARTVVLPWTRSKQLGLRVVIGGAIPVKSDIPASLLILIGR